MMNKNERSEEMKILERLNPTNTGSFNRLIAHALGLDAAVVYSALISKREYYASRDMLDSEGWFYSTVEDMQESTSMAICKQRSAIKVLTDKGLVEVSKRGMPARRHFRLRDDVEILDKLLEQGKEISAEHNPIVQSDENRLTCCVETEQQVVIFCDNKSAQNELSIINHKINKSKEINLNQSILGGDEMDRIDERSNYLEIIRENIEYDCFDKRKQEKVDELVEIMLDVICSTKCTTRVNSEEIPTSTVKSRFLKLTHEHIEYVLLALKKNTSAVKNIKAYLITALYNAPTTKDAFFGSLVNHDMYGSG